MATYKQYSDNGNRLWKVTGYLGIDPLTGKQKNINRGNFKTKKEAQLFFSRAQKDLLNGGRRKNVNKRRTFKDVYLDWLDTYKITVRVSTLIKTEKIFNQHILPKIGDMLITKIESHILQSMINDWHKRFKIHKRYYNYMVKVFDYAKKLRYIDTNPTDYVIIPTQEVAYKRGKSVKEYYTKDELETLLEACKRMNSGKWHAFFRLLAFSGVRRGEALALTWNDVNFKESCINVNKTLTHGRNNSLIVQKPKTKNSIRTIYLDKITMGILKEWRLEQTETLFNFGFNTLRKEQLVFCKWNSNTHIDLATPRNALLRICKQCNLEMINIHGFRHTHCSLLFEANVPMKDVKERLGHADIQTTMNIYTHVTDESKNNSVELFANYVNF